MALAGQHFPGRTGSPPEATVGYRRNTVSCYDSVRHMLAPHGFINLGQRSLYIGCESCAWRRSRPLQVAKFRDEECTPESWQAVLRPLGSAFTALRLPQNAVSVGTWVEILGAVRGQGASAKITTASSGGWGKWTLSLLQSCGHLSTHDYVTRFNRERIKWVDVACPETKTISQTEDRINSF